MPSLTLAIETSQHQGGVALRDAGGRTHVEMLAAARRHDDDLLPAIDRLFRRAGVSRRDLGAVGVSAGPGGFTGLRIAVSTAKMFAEALGAKLVSVPSALVAAESCASGGPIIVCLASKGESFWSTHLDRDAAGFWKIAGEPGLATAADLELEDVRALLADEHAPRALIDQCTRGGVEVLPPRFEPQTCLAVTLRLLAAGQTVDPLRLAPLYPRQPEAVTLWDRKLRQGE